MYVVIFETHQYFYISLQQYLCIFHQLYFYIYNLTRIFTNPTNSISARDIQ